MLEATVSRMTRREFVAGAAAMGATLAWGETRPWRSRERFTERRDLFAEGVASGDPAPDSVLLWTRASAGGSAAVVPLTVEVAEDAAFERVVASERAARARARPTTPAACWSAGCSPRRTYWYRFIDEDGHGSRIGRTRTAPARRRSAAGALRVRELPERLRGRAERLPPDDLRGRARRRRRTISASCCTSATSSTRSWTTRRTGPAGMYDRRLRDVVRYPDGEKVAGLPRRRHARATTARSIARTCTIPTCRTRARAGRSSRCGTTTSSPGWAGSRSSASAARCGQRRRVKVAANQAWFEYQPARVRKAGGDVARALRGARREGRADRALRRPRPRPGAEQPARDREPDAPTARCASGGTSI